jgi:hypothetical protein
MSRSIFIPFLNNLIRDVAVFTIATALAVLAFSVQARALPPCNHPSYTTKSKCENTNPLCDWHCGHCWWKDSQCRMRPGGRSPSSRY